MKKNDIPFSIPNGAQCGEANSVCFEVLYFELFDK